MEKVEKTPYFQRKASQWVSQITLLGCTLIMIILLYAVRESEELAESWVGDIYVIDVIDGSN